MHTSTCIRKILGMGMGMGMGMGKGKVTVLGARVFKARFALYSSTSSRVALGLQYYSPTS